MFPCLSHGNSNFSIFLSAVHLLVYLLSDLFITWDIQFTVSFFLCFTCYHTLFADWKIHVSHPEDSWVVESAFQTGAKICWKVKGTTQSYPPWETFHFNYVVAFWFPVVDFTCRCIEDMEQHLEQSVLSKLPSSYQSHLKQSSSSEEDDMGKIFGHFEQHVCVCLCVLVFLQLCLCACLLTVSALSAWMLVEIVL